MQSEKRARATEVNLDTLYEVFDGCKKIYLATAYYEGYVLADAFLESTKVEPGMPLNTLINNDIEAGLSDAYVLRPSVISFNRIRVFRAYDGHPYAYGLELLNSLKTVFVVGLPPYDIVSASLFVLNPALLHALSEVVRDRKVASYLETVYGIAKKVASIRPTDSFVMRMLEEPPTLETRPTLAVKVGGKALKSIVIYAYYDADSEETMFPATAELTYRGKTLLYRIPTCDWKTYIESFRNLLEIFNALDDLRMFKNLIRATMKEYAKAILLIKTVKNYFQHRSDG